MIYYDPGPGANVFLMFAIDVLSSCLENENAGLIYSVEASVLSLAFDANFALFSSELLIRYMHQAQD